MGGGGGGGGPVLRSGLSLPSNTNMIDVLREGIEISEVRIDD